MPKKSQGKRKTRIPKKVKNEVWDKYIGKQQGVGKCYICAQQIDSKHFECGHIVAHANGGKSTVSNLRAVCEPCNKSQGTQNMNDYKKKHYTTTQNTTNSSSFLQGNHSFFPENTSSSPAALMFANKYGFHL